MCIASIIAITVGTGITDITNIPVIILITALITGIMMTTPVIAAIIITGADITIVHIIAVVLQLPFRYHVRIITITVISIIGSSVGMVFT